jgi:sugar lactone lactonase YvrE
MAQPRILLTGLAFGESPRWHDDRLWFSNWGTQEVVTADLDGKSEVAARVPTTIPYSIDWLPDGRLLVVPGQEALLLRREPDGSLITHADLSSLGPVFNEIVVDGRGNAYVNGEIVVLVTPDGSVRQVAEGLAFGNGMAVTPDNRTLIVAESHGNRLTAFDIAADGSLSNRHVWAGPRLLRLHARRPGPQDPLHAGSRVAGHGPHDQRGADRPGADRRGARATHRLALTRRTSQSSR